MHVFAWLHFQGARRSIPQQREEGAGVMSDNEDEKDGKLSKEEELRRKLLSVKKLKPGGGGSSKERREEKEGGRKGGGGRDDRHSSSRDGDRRRREESRGDRRDRSLSRDSRRPRYSGGGGDRRRSEDRYDRSRDRDRDSKYGPARGGGGGGGGADSRHHHHRDRDRDRDHHHGSRREDQRSVERKQSSSSRGRGEEAAKGGGLSDRRSHHKEEMDVVVSSPTAAPRQSSSSPSRPSKASPSSSSSSSSPSRRSSSSRRSSPSSSPGGGEDSEVTGGGGKRKGRWDDSEDEAGGGSSEEEEGGGGGRRGAAANKRRKSGEEAGGRGGGERSPSASQHREGAAGEQEGGGKEAANGGSEAEAREATTAEGGDASSTNNHVASSTTAGGTTTTTAPLDDYNPLLHGCRSVEHYERIGMIAQGTYGVVYRAKNTVTDEIVALKQVKNLGNKEGFSFNALREINILLDLRHPNIVRVKEMVVGSSMDKVYMVMEYYENDLKHVLDTVGPSMLKEGDKKYLLHQLLQGVAYMHERWYLHRDLKTSNLLISKRGHLAVGDLGLARKYGSPVRPYTEVVVTPGYRCPELYLGAKLYSTAVDMWSVGCIFGELLTSKPMFRGENDIKQLEAIFKIMGTPTEERWPGYSQLPLAKTVQFKKLPNNLRHYFYSAHEATYSAACYDLLEKLLCLDPSQRISAADALKHEFFREPPMMTPPESFPELPQRRTTG